MAQLQGFAKDQPEGFKNRIENVAIVGAAGQVGKFITEELLKTGRHKVTAITRTDSTNKLPDGVRAARVDYDNFASLVSALRGQDALIITLSVDAPADTQSKLNRAAAEAGVPWIVPNGWGPDLSEEQPGKDVLLGPGFAAARAEIETLGKSAWVELVCGFWYEFSLAGAAERFGFELERREVTFYDDGNTRINTSTWAQCGRAVAGLLSLKVLPEDENDKSSNLMQFKNGYLYVSSFNVSQKDMFESVKRVTGTTDGDWKIGYEPSKKRFEDGQEEMRKGSRDGFAKLLYARIFYPDAGGEYEKIKGLHNELLGLPKEDLDEFTKIAVGMGKSAY